MVHITAFQAKQQDICLIKVRLRALEDIQSVKIRLLKFNAE